MASPRTEPARITLPLSDDPKDLSESRPKEVPFSSQYYDGIYNSEFLSLDTLEGIQDLCKRMLFKHRKGEKFHDLEKALTDARPASLFKCAIKIFDKSEQDFLHKSRRRGQVTMLIHISLCV